LNITLQILHYIHINLSSLTRLPLS